MKRFLIIFVLFITVNIVTAQTADPPSLGDGGSGNPYQIATLNNLYWITQNSSSWDKYFIQKDDIDASATSTWDGGTGFNPIGNGSVNFTGSYNGGNYTINGLFINRGSTEYIGLFGYTNGSNIQNLGLTNIDITGANNTGGLVGRHSNSSTIQNCYSTGSILGGNNAGGLIALTNLFSTVENCYSTVTLVAGNYAGGLAGVNYAEISNSYATGQVTGYDFTGGLVGYNYSSDASISSCYSIGNVISHGAAGGFVGWNRTDATVSNCYTTGDVTRNDIEETYSTFAGFCGSNNASTIEYSYSTGSVFSSTGTPWNVGGNTDKGFVGIDLNSTYYTANYYDSQESNQTDDSSVVTPNYTAVAKTIDEMKGITSGNNISDWGWSTGVWERIGDNYPRLINNPDAALPVTLSSFETSYINSASTLSWTTQSENSNLGWNIYRSDSEEFAEGSVQNANLIEGAGTTSEPTEYSFSDPYPAIQGSDYWFWLESISFSGESEIFGPVMLSVPNVDPGQNTPISPETYGLYQNYPNPFNPTTDISFALEEAGKCELTIFDIKGRKVKTLFTGNIEAEIIYNFTWNGDDESGKPVASGIYYYKMKAGKIQQTKKMIMLK